MLNKSNFLEYSKNRFERDCNLLLKSSYDEMLRFATRIHYTSTLSRIVCYSALKMVYLEAIEHQIEQEGEIDYPEINLFSDENRLRMIKRIPELNQILSEYVKLQDALPKEEIKKFRYSEYMLLAAVEDIHVYRPESFDFSTLSSKYISRWDRFKQFIKVIWQSPRFDPFYKTKYKTYPEALENYDEFKNKYLDYMEELEERYEQINEVEQVKENNNLFSHPAMVRVINQMSKDALIAKTDISNVYVIKTTLENFCHEFVTRSNLQGMKIHRKYNDLIRKSFIREIKDGVPVEFAEASFRDILEQPGRNTKRI